VHLQVANGLTTMTAKERSVRHLNVGVLFCDAIGPLLRHRRASEER
jgi:hypothetical protein